MSITINGNGTITGYTPTTISGQLAATKMPTGSVIQTINNVATDKKEERLFTHGQGL